MTVRAQPGWKQEVCPGLPGEWQRAQVSTVFHCIHKPLARSESEREQRGLEPAPTGDATCLQHGASQPQLHPELNSSIFVSRHAIIKCYYLLVVHKLMSSSWSCTAEVCTQNRPYCLIAFSVSSNSGYLEAFKPYLSRNTHHPAMLQQRFHLYIFLLSEKQS